MFPGFALVQPFVTSKSSPGFLGRKCTVPAFLLRVLVCGRLFLMVLQGTLQGQALPEKEIVLPGEWENYKANRSLSPDGNYAAHLSKDQQLIVTNLITNERDTFPEQVTGYRFGADSKLIGIFFPGKGRNNNYEIRDLSRWQSVNHIEFQLWMGPIDRVAISASLDTVALCFKIKGHFKVQFWDIQRQQRLGTRKIGKVKPSRLFFVDAVPHTSLIILSRVRKKLNIFSAKATLQHWEFRGDSLTKACQIEIPEHLSLHYFNTTRYVPYGIYLTDIVLYDPSLHRITDTLKLDLFPSSCEYLASDSLVLIGGAGGVSGYHYPSMRHLFSLGSGPGFSRASFIRNGQQVYSLNKENIQIWNNPLRPERADSSSLPHARPTQMLSHPLLSTGNYHALLIGCQDYLNDRFPDLPGTLEQLDQLKTELISHYSFRPEHTHFLSNPTRKEIVSALSRLQIQSGPNDNLLLVYYGHGEFNEQENHGYWCPVDIETDSKGHLLDNYIPNSFLQTKFRGFRSKHIFLISDACFSGTILTSYRDATKPVIELNEYLSRTGLTSVPGAELALADGRFAKTLLETLSTNKQAYLTALDFSNQVKTKLQLSSTGPSPEFGYLKNALPGDYTGRTGDFIFFRSDAPANLQADQDRDGLSDAEDRCPETFGPVFNQGCPIDDQDGDGVLDVVDWCPHNAGFSGNRGCPDGDLDKDGIINTQDDCPRTPGSTDLSGCPLYPGFKEEDDNMMLTGYTIFYDQTKSANLPDTVYEPLGAIAEFIKTRFNGTLRLVISGRTDKSGSQASNLRLSQRRVERIKDFFVMHGIPADRIELKFVGEERPLFPNNTPEARQYHRRVEISFEFP